MARYLGLAFVGTPLVVFVETTHAVRLARTFTLPSGRHDFEIDFMERKTVELADGVLLNTVESGEELRELGWVFPPVVAVRRAVASVWGGWLEARIDGVKKARVLTSKPVFLSVCIATHNRAVWLREALVSLQNQTVSHFEVIVVDDGSTDRDVETLRAELAPVFHEKGWRWLQQDNAGPAAARYRAAKKASGEYLLFMDDDDIAYPDEIERFALAAQKKGDIIACILGMHPASENTFPATAQLPERNGTATRPVGWTPIGGDVALAAFINVAGYAHALYRRKMFLKLGGFKSGKEVVFEDFEFLIRALIAGYRIDVVPEVLMLYRRTRQSRSMGQDIFAGHLNSLQPLAALLPPALRGLLLPLRREWYERHRQRRDGEI